LARNSDWRILFKVPFLKYSSKASFQQILGLGATTRPGLSKLRRIRRKKIDQLYILLPAGRGRSSARCGLFRRFSINHFVYDFIGA
jgi:hypothetical protein